MLTFLWCVPRSVSTAFEKMMWHSGHFEVISEPLLELYKQSLLSKQKRLEVKERVAEIFDDLERRSSEHLIFVKDMGYHAESFISDCFIKKTSHSFLIRDPRLSIPSLYKMRAAYTEDQTGFKGLLDLYNRVKRISGTAPLIMDAGGLIKSPDAIVAKYFKQLNLPMSDQILSWPKGSQAAWNGRENWHLDAINSEGFENRPEDFDEHGLPDKVKHSIKLALPIYSELHSQII